MNKEEIKEILFRLEIVARKHTIEICDDGNIETMPASVVDELRLNNYSAKILLNYITNLQEENEYSNHCNEELRKKITNLEYKIERLEEENKHIFANVNDDELLISNAMNYAEAQDYKSRNEKAIKYIELGLANEEEAEELLDILQGVDKE